jgi:predicted alpha/beta hydrolase
MSNVVTMPAPAKREDRERDPAVAGREIWIEASDGYQLSALVYGPDNAPAAAVQINGATGVPKEYYRAFAEWLASRGYLVATFDYRGMGKSLHVDIRDFKGEIGDWGAKDATGVTAWLDGKVLSTTPIYCIGHSMGGQAIGLQPNINRFTAFAGIAAQTGHWRFWPTPKQRLRMLFRWYVLLPGIAKIFGYAPKKYSGMEDMPASLALTWSRWGRNRHYISDPRGRPIREHFHSYRKPALFVGFSDDRAGPATAIDELATFYANAAVTRRTISPGDYGLDQIGHFGFFKRAMPKALWSDLLDWLTAQRR